MHALCFVAAHTAAVQFLCCCAEWISPPPCSAGVSACFWCCLTGIVQPEVSTPNRCFWLLFSLEVFSD